MICLIATALAGAQTDPPAATARAPRSIAELPPLSDYERYATVAPDDLPAMVFFSGAYKHDTWTETRFSVTRRIKIFNDAGLAFSTFEFRTRLFETVETVEGRTLQPDGRVVALDPERDGRHSLTYAPLWGPEILHRYRLPQVEPGCIVEYRYTILTQLGPGLRFNYWFLQDWVTTLRTRFTLDMPSDFMPFTAGLENISSSAIPDEEEENDRRLITYSFADIPALRIEQFMPPPSFLRSRLVVDYEWTASPASEPVGFWSQVGRSQAQRQRHFMEGVPKAEAVVRDMKISRKELPERVKTIVRWLRENIVNLSAEEPEILEDGEEPDWTESETADEVIERGEGTSLEITRLAVTLLRAAGVDAFLGLAVSRENGVLRYSFLDPQQFDQALVAVRLPGDEVAFLQPGAPNSPAMSVGWQIQGALALICTPDQGFFARLPVDRAEQNSRGLELELELDAGGVARGTARFSYDGQESMVVRNRFAGAQPADWENWYRSWFVQRYPGSGLTVTRIGEGENGDDALLVECVVTLPAFATRRGGELQVDPSAFTAVALEIGNLDGRRQPVYLPYPYQDRVNVRLQLPDGSRIVVPGEKTVSAEVGSYHAAWESGRNEATWRRNFIQNRIFFDRAEARKLELFLQDLRAAEEHDQARIGRD